MKLTIGIDISKRYFQIFGRDESGKTIVSKRLTRGRMLPYFSNLPKSLITMEACGGAHYWARTLRSQGHELRLISPQHVKPYVMGNKNDRNDAEAICEASTRPGMRFVAIKSVEQQDVLSVHRIRERLIKGRTALVNEMRGLLAERGQIIPTGISKFRIWIREFMAGGIGSNSQECSDLFLELLGSLYREFLDVDQLVKKYEKQLEGFAGRNGDCQRIMAIPGVGPIIATALVSSIDAKSFKNTRQLSAWSHACPLLLFRVISQGALRRPVDIGPYMSYNYGDVSTNA